jgi:hypothetical protein
MNEEDQDIFEGCMHKGLSKMDFAKICFELSRSSDSSTVLEVEKLWLGCLSNYIVELENEAMRFADVEQ